MPVGYIVKSNKERIAELESRLTAEWKMPGFDVIDATSQPILIEDEQPVRSSIARKPLHLYVIWDEWEDLNQEERSEIILDAYEASHATVDVRRVTVAMGLTAAEARKMGLNYKVAGS